MKNICEWRNCKNIGDFKAPVEKDNSKNFRLLCKDHIKAFNNSWNYFEGMSQNEIENFLKSDLTWHRPTQKFGSSGPAPSGDSYFWVAGGGGGASYPGYRPEPNNGGSGGGGRGALYGSPTTDVGDGVQNSGGGGGGGVHSSPNANQTHGGAGGSGLVIIAYPT